MSNDSKNQIRLRIHTRIRRRVKGTPERPRLAVFRSVKHIYAQVIDDLKGHTIVAAASTEKSSPLGQRRQGRQPGGGEERRQTGCGTGQGTRDQSRSVRSRRVSVSRAREGAGGCGARGRVRLLGLRKTKCF
jgi:hypothetical protein